MEQEIMEVSVPPYFLCPISLQIMKDPIIVPTGITYDRESIEKWVYSNKKYTCPITKQTLNNVQETDIFTPNHTLRRLIQAWCTLNASYGVERFPTPKPPASKTQIVKLINEGEKHSGQVRIQCLNKLKCIASESIPNKRCMESVGAVEFLGRVVVEEGNGSGEALGVLCLLKITEEQVKILLLEKDGVLFDVLARVSNGSDYELRDCAMIFMKSLLELAEPAQLARLRLAHFMEVVQVLKNPASTPRTVRAGLKVLALACPWGRNRVRMVEAGAVPIIVDLLLNTSSIEPESLRRSTEMVLAVLDQLCGCAEGRAALLAHGAGLAIVSKLILRVSHYATDRGVRIVSAISRFAVSSAILREMVEVGVVAKLCMVLQVDGETKTKEKVREILKLHGRVWRTSPCAPPSLAFASLHC